MAATPSGKGVFFAYSKIVEPDVLDEPTFLKWYDEEHIPEAVSSGGIKSAVRSVDVRHREGRPLERPYLSVYPLEDLSFVLSEKMAAISVTSPLLPGPDDAIVYTMADFDVRWYNLVDVYDPARKGKDQAKFLLLRESDKDLDQASREMNDKRMLQNTPGFLRSIRLRHVGGFWSHGGGKVQLPCSKWLQICEFDGDAPPSDVNDDGTSQRTMVFRIENRDAEDKSRRGEFFHGLETQYDITPAPRSDGVEGKQGEGDQSVAWKNSNTPVANS